MYPSFREVQVLRYLLLISISSVCGTVGEASAAEEVTIEFSFRGSRGCTTVFPNPEIKLRNIPTGARSVQFRFRNGKNELGGQETLLPQNGVVPPDTIRTWGPCNPGVYTYDAIVKSESGEVLTKAERSEPFPHHQ